MLTFRSSFWLIQSPVRARSSNQVTHSCCNDGTRPVIFKIERIDIPESDEETEWLAKQDFSNSAEDAFSG